jgi:hypothetical protein
MKVDHYRCQRVPEYSFIVPAGADLSSYEGEEAKYVAAFQPIEAVELDFDLEALVTEDLARFIDDLQRVGISMMMSHPVAEVSESSDSGID